MSWLVYFLAIMPSLHGTGVALAVLGSIATVIAGIIMMFTASMAADGDYSKGDRESAEAVHPLVRSVFKGALISAATGFALSSLIPVPDDLLKAYLMVEGSKVVTAQNAETATKEIVKRIDHMIGLIGHGDQDGKKEE